MRVFGYGSLMWDNWQRAHDGANGVLAELIPNPVRADS